MRIDFLLNGKRMSIETPPERRVVDLLRVDLHLTGTKEGCGSGECGACTILVDGDARLACLMLAAQLQGHRVVTVEGLADGDKLHPIQQAFVKHGAVQCGFCTSGMQLSAVATLSAYKLADPESSFPLREEIRHGLSGNLCRCGGYAMIVDAVEAVVHQGRSLLPIQDKSLSIASMLENSIVADPSLEAHSNGVLKESTHVFFPQTLTTLRDIYQKCVLEDTDQPPALYCGGTDFFVKCRMVLSHTLICLESLSEIKEIQEQGDFIVIGAAVTHSQMLADPRVNKYFPILVRALKQLGSPQIRNMGTLGGNICTASPAGDCLPPLYVLYARVELQSCNNSSSKRYLPISEFILGPGKTALTEGEILTSVWIPKAGPNTRQHFEKVGKRNALACSVVSLAACLEIDSNHKVQSAPLAWGSLAPTVFSSPQVEALLVGQEISMSVLEKAAAMVREQVTPLNDVRASAAYRRQIAGNLLFRLDDLNTLEQIA
jgi:xanthine dehydrogenase small subunit